jgi:hypothetical protein
VKLRLHVFADGRCVLSTESPLTAEMVRSLRRSWEEWVTCPDAYSLLIVNGVVDVYDVVFTDDELHITEGK